MLGLMQKLDILPGNTITFDKHGKIVDEKPFFKKGNRNQKDIFVLYENILKNKRFNTVFI